jgi:hypothetical protein
MVSCPSCGKENPEGFAFCGFCTAPLGAAVPAAADAFALAAAAWESFGNVYEHAQALLGQGRCLVDLGRAADATAPLHQAREIFARLQARPALSETDSLLERAIALTS